MIEATFQQFLDAGFLPLVVLWDRDTGTALRAECPACNCDVRVLDGHLRVHGAGATESSREVDCRGSLMPLTR